MDLEDKLKNLKTADDVSVYAHVNEILQKMVENQEEYPLANFERYSEEIQRSRKSNQPLLGHIKDNPAELAELFTKLKLTLAKPEKTEDEPETQNLGELRNLLSDERISRKAGVSISENEVYYLNASVKRLIKKRGLAKVDFWGKIFTRGADYFVLDVKSGAEGEAEEIAESHEPRGTGINANTYLVTTDIFAEDAWTELPVVTAAQLRQSREVRYVFSGDLERKLVSSPVFSGQEKHYVR